MSRKTARGSEFFEIPSGRVEIRWDGALATLYFNGIESSCTNVDDPTSLEFEYMQHATCALDCVIGEAAPVRALHLGGAGCTLPLAWSYLRPKSKQTAVEIDPDLPDLVRRVFDLPKSPALSIRIGDGREVMSSFRDSTFNVIVRDTFANGQVPAHLATLECAKIAREKLKDGGLYILNCAHGGGSDARAEIATISEVFGQVMSIQDPKVGRSGRRGNVIVIGYVGADYPVEDLDRALRRLPLPARVTHGVNLTKWCAGTSALRDADIGYKETGAS